MSEARDRLR